MKSMSKYFKRENFNEYYINRYSDSYLNHFEREKLVYICPQADDILVEYDHNAVYVLCGVVQRRLGSPLSMV